jgi:hypothetical protein
VLYGQANCRTNRYLLRCGSVTNGPLCAAVASDDLNFPGDAPSGDYIVVMFPQNVSDADIAKAKQVSTIQADAKAAFEAWSWEGRSGMDLVKELFPTPDQYHRVQNDFADAKKYLTSHIDHLMLKLE